MLLCYLYLYIGTFFIWSIFLKGSNIIIRRDVNMNKTKRIVTTAAIAALYAATTLVIAPLSFGNYQFRISEVLVLLALFDPLYIGGLTLGCFIANMLGPNGIMDVIFGTIATFISVLAVYYTPKVIRNSKTALIIASLWPTIINGLIIGVMLSYLYALPLILTIFQVALGEFVVVTILGVPFINFIKPYMKKIIPNL